MQLLSDDVADSVKIDTSFVVGLHVNPHHKAVDEAFFVLLKPFFEAIFTFLAHKLLCLRNCS